MCCHTNRIGAGSPCSKREKPDSPVSEIGHSGFVKTDNNQGRHQAVTRCFSSGQAVSERWRDVNHD
jgi:hypothetical protein